MMCQALCKYFTYTYNLYGHPQTTRPNPHFIDEKMEAQEDEETCGVWGFEPKAHPLAICLCLLSNPLLFRNSKV